MFYAAPAVPRAIRSRAFTLVELLVVVGIIAVLIAIIMPALRGARESANRIRCASNLRQLATALITYATDHRGFFPRGATVRDGQRAEDWIHWQTGRLLEESAIARYVSITPDLFRCPSDQYDQHQAWNPPEGAYTYSYAMNVYLTSFTPSYARGKARPNITQSKNSAELILLVEEQETTIDDGNWLGKPSAPPYITNLLAIRHDRFYEPDVVTAAIKVPNPAGRGNAAFVDTHVDFIPRSLAHTETAYIPPQ